MCGQTYSVSYGPGQGSIPTGTARTGHTSVSEDGYLGPQAVNPTLSLNSLLLFGVGLSKGALGLTLNPAGYWPTLWSRVL